MSLARSGMTSVQFCMTKRSARSLKTFWSSETVTRACCPFLQQDSGEMMWRYSVIMVTTFMAITKHVQSLIVRYRCKLELWDDSDGLESGARPDLVIDRTSR